MAVFEKGKLTFNRLSEFSTVTATHTSLNLSRRRFKNLSYARTAFAYAYTFAHARNIGGGAAPDARAVWPDAYVREVYLWYDRR